MDRSLYSACSEGNKAEAQKSFNPRSVNYVNLTDGDTPLHQVCKQGWLDFVKKLIEQFGCNPNVMTRSNQSPLHYACRYGHIDVVEYLINEQHSNPLLRDNGQYEPLDYALNCNQPSIAVYLCQHCIFSDEMLNPNRIKTTINLINYMFRPILRPLPLFGEDNINPLDPKWKTADGDNILQLVGSSKTCISHISSAVMLKILTSSNAKNYLTAFKPDLKTSDGDTLLQLLCQSMTCILGIPKAVFMDWLRAIIPFNVRMPNSEAADGDALIQLVCQSQSAVSQISSEVLSTWLRDISHDIELEKLNIIPQWITADGDTLLQLVCQSGKCLSLITSAVLSKWLDDITLDLMKLNTPESKTADGDTLFEIICQSKKNLLQLDLVLSKWLKCNRHLKFKVVSESIINNRKTAAGDILLRLIIREPICMSKTSSVVLSKWLSDSKVITTDQLKLVNPKWKTFDNDCFFHVLCQSKIEDEVLVELIQYYMQKYGFDPEILDSDRNTSLHLACQAQKPALVSYLLYKARCDPNIENKVLDLPLDMAVNPKIINSFCQHDQVAVHSRAVTRWINNRAIDQKTMMEILKVLVDTKGYTTADGTALLHIICKARNRVACDKAELIEYLLTECHVDPECLDNQGKVVLQLTLEMTIMETLVQHGAKLTANVVFELISSRNQYLSDSSICKLFILSKRKETMLWNPDHLNRDGKTALHLACEHNRSGIVNYLLTEAKCDVNTIDSQTSLLELTDKLEIAKMLIIHGARVSPKVVVKFLAMEKVQEKATLVKLMLKTWNPYDRDTDGYTALHLACLEDNPIIVNLLLTVAHCDPNIKSRSEEVPLQMTTSTGIIKDLIKHGAKTSIMYKYYKKSLGTDKPIQPPVKVFIVGNPSVGKSTLAAALKKKIGVFRVFSGKVSGVDERTVGIVPHDLESKIFGLVTLYDFAGHKEFYSGHAALLQTAIQSTPPIFLLVINICEDEVKIIQTILYWISFLENQCASISCKPHVILVGSHVDALKGIAPNDKIQRIVDSFDARDCFTNMEYISFVAMNCQYHESTGMNDLRRLLIKSCEELRIQEPITFNAHCFLLFLIETFINLPAVTIKKISDKIENQKFKEGVLEFLPRNIEALYKICLELNDRGHILFLKDSKAVENSCIVIDKECLLCKISGTLFAPEGFKEHGKLASNTGVVPRSRIIKYFSRPDNHDDPNIIISLLIHLEFCLEIPDQALHQLISEQLQYPEVSEAGECCYLFPGLISMRPDDTVWQMQSKYDHNFGWILKCIHQEQFFSSRFHQVLLLRLAFSFALESSCNQGIGIHRNCYIWTNGIFWGNIFGMQILVEVTDKHVVLLIRFQNANLLECVHHRSEVISIILQCKEQFCPRVIVTESFVDSSSPLQYPLNLSNELENVCSLRALATAVISDCECPSVVFQCHTIPVEKFLSFEPYLDMKLSTIQELWDEINQNKVISETFLSRFLQQATDELSSLIKLTLSGSEITYKDFRQMVDQYSIFSGRNVLVSHTDNVIKTVFLMCTMDAIHGF